MNEARTYNEINKCVHVLHDLRGGCSGCNFDVESIIGDLEHRAADRDEWRALARELRRVAANYAAAGLRLQQALGALSGPKLERLGLYAEWEMACLKHGDLVIAEAKLREKEERDAG